jgi:hypothetical protein
MTTFYMYLYGFLELGDNMDETLAPNYYLSWDEFAF